MTDFDLVVVGGGIVGAAVVWRAISRFPRWRILWLERGQFGAGCTASSGGLLAPLGKTPRIRDLANRSRVLFPLLDRDVGGIVIRQHQAYCVGSLARTKETEGWFLDATPPPVEEEPPHWGVIQVPHGNVISGPFKVGQVDPFQVVKRIVEWSANRGVTAHNCTAVEKWGEVDNKLLITGTSGGQFWGRRLVFATGPWPVPGLQSVDWPVRTKRVACCYLAGMPPADASAISFLDVQAFLVPAPQDGRWILSFRSEEWDALPESTPTGLNSCDRQTVAKILDCYLPELARSVSGGRAFCDAYSDDESPRCMRLESRLPVLIGGACSGSGVRTALGLADEIVTLLKEQ